ncbi:MAG: TRAP transporter small permease subunit [Pseudomonadota bacterium]|nr:TRAP transporter small permease subunit [Pseudomonadota bacterium]
MNASTVRESPLCVRLLRLANTLERPVVWLGRAGSWLILPMIGVILFDAVCRRFLRKLPFVIDNGLYTIMNSPVLQDSEWHLHTILFCTSMAYAYIYNAHVRLDLFRPRFSVNGRLWIETLGGLILLIPFLALMIYHCWSFFQIAWDTNEGTPVLIGIGHRWFIKFFLVIGFVLMLASALSIVIRLIIRLYGPSDLHDATQLKKITEPTYSAFS